MLGLMPRLWLGCSRFWSADDPHPVGCESVDRDRHHRHASWHERLVTPGAGSVLTRFACRGPLRLSWTGPTPAEYGSMCATTNRSVDRRRRRPRDRGGEHPQAHLATYTGIFRVDAYSGYGKLYEPGRSPGPIFEAACWGPRPS